MKRKMLVLCLLLAVLLAMPAYAATSVEAADTSGYSAKITRSMSGTTAKFTCTIERPYSPTGDANSKITYQWLLSTDGGKTWRSINGATSAVYSVAVTNANHTWRYKCQVKISSTGAIDYVDDAYLAFLGRHNDYTGYEHWGSRLLAHTMVDYTNQEVLIGINSNGTMTRFGTETNEIAAMAEAAVISREWLLKYSTYNASLGRYVFNTDYAGELVRQAYRFFFRREATQADVDHHCRQFDTGGSLYRVFDQVTPAVTMQYPIGIYNLLHNFANEAECLNAGSAFRNRYNYAPYDASTGRFNWGGNTLATATVSVKTIQSGVGTLPNLTASIKLQSQSGSNATLVCSTSGITGTNITYKWEVCNWTSTWSQVQSSTSSTYTYNVKNGSNAVRCTAYASNDLYYTTNFINIFGVWYDANGGTGAPAPQARTDGTAINLSTAKPTRTGHDFVNWLAGGAAYSPGANIPSSTNGSLTMVAQWKPHTYQITYNANGGDAGTVPGSQTKTYGVTLTLQTQTPEYLGYGFTGWNTAPDGSGTTYSPGGLFDINANTTLYAQWEPNTHLVTYDANGGDASTVPDAQTKYYAIPLQLTSETPTHEGYKFICWSATPDGTGAVYNPGEEYTVDEDMTLYAQWKEKNSMRATLKNATAGGRLSNTERFNKGEYGNLTITLKGEIVKVEIAYPDHLRSFAEPEDLLNPRTLTIGNGLSGDGSTGLAEFFIPINFDDTVEYRDTVTVTATFADGEVITQTPYLIVVPNEPIPRWFHTRLL